MGGLGLQNRTVCLKLLFARYRGKEFVMALPRNVLLLMICCVLLVVSIGCSGGVSNLKWTALPGTPADLQPYTGTMVVIWKEHGFPAAYKNREYVLVGRVSGRSLWCGVTAPLNNEELHARLIEEAKKHGGNGIILDCGYGGSVSEEQCYCFADVIRFMD